MNKSVACQKKIATVSKALSNKKTSLNTRKNLKRLKGVLNQGPDLYTMDESSDTISKALKSIKSAIILGSIASFLWLLKGPQDLPGAKVDRAPWIKDKHTEYWKNEVGNEEEEIVYVPIMRRDLDHVTAYVPEDRKQTDEDPEIASCGRYSDLAKKGINIIALSRDLFFDKKAKEIIGRTKPLCGLPAVIKTKDGEEIKGIIMDTMNPRFKKRADLGISAYHHGGDIEKAKKEAYRFGKKEAREIIVFLPIKKKAVEEGIKKEIMKDKLKELIESSMRKRTKTRTT